MNSPVNYLEWDSIFFGFPVYKIDYNYDFDIEKVFFVHGDQIALYYVFSDAKNISENILSLYNGKLVDEKVLLIKRGLSFKTNILNDIVLYKEKTPNEDLYRLATLSGEHSRYKTDKRLPSFTFEKMYNLWIENSCKNENSIIYICKQVNKTVGFITLEIDVNSGIIGLLAVDDNVQGYGIGYELMCKAENHLVALGIKAISVSTQRNNEKALKFYERLGYKIETISNIYHFILNNKI